MTRLSLNSIAADGSAAVGIVGSAGGIAALIELLGCLPSLFPLPIIVAQHLAPSAPSLLPGLLTHHGNLPAKWAENGEIPRGGIVYIAPAGHNLDVGSGRFAISPLSPSARSWLSCPDTLFTGLARRYGAGAVGIVLSGMATVGIDGLRTIRRAGGITMAQSKASSAHFAMPLGAIDLSKAEIVLPPKRLAEALIVLAEDGAAFQKREVRQQINGTRPSIVKGTGFTKERWVE